jgi:hypothetical protein
MFLAAQTDFMGSDFGTAPGPVWAPISSRYILGVCEFKTFSATILRQSGILGNSAKTGKQSPSTIALRE